MTINNTKLELLREIERQAELARLAREDANIWKQRAKAYKDLWIGYPSKEEGVATEE